MKYIRNGYIHWFEIGGHWTGIWLDGWRICITKGGLVKSKYLNKRAK